MHIVIGIVVYLFATSVFIASGKFLKKCDDEIKTIRSNR